MQGLFLRFVGYAHLSGTAFQFSLSSSKFTVGRFWVRRSTFGASTLIQALNPVSIFLGSIRGPKNRLKRYTTGAETDWDRKDDSDTLAVTKQFPKLNRGTDNF